jgi:hypothetical protein
MMDLDLAEYPLIDWRQFSWLRDQGVPVATLMQIMQVRVVDGALAFYEEVSGDVVLWHPKSGELTSWAGNAFALGEDNIFNAGTYAFDNYLVIHTDPLDWLRDGGHGIIVLRWELAFDMLRDATRIAVSEELLPTYRQHMTPRHMPELAVLASDRRLAA